MLHQAAASSFNKLRDRAWPRTLASTVPFFGAAADRGPAGLAAECGHAFTAGGAVAVGSCVALVIMMFATPAVVRARFGALQIPPFTCATGSTAMLLHVRAADTLPAPAAYRGLAQMDAGLTDGLDEPLDTGVLTGGHNLLGAATPPYFWLLETPQVDGLTPLCGTVPGRFVVAHVAPR